MKSHLIPLLHSSQIALRTLSEIYLPAAIQIFSMLSPSFLRDVGPSPSSWNSSNPASGSICCLAGSQSNQDQGAPGAKHLKKGFENGIDMGGGIELEYMWCWFLYISMIAGGFYFGSPLYPPLLIMMRWKFVFPTSKQLWEVNSPCSDTQKLCCWLAILYHTWLVVWNIFYFPIYWE